ncbi:DUF512 domain-containing protein [Clostridium akagii]|uniref:DUF512 domain-containing protein n=1 Tax=Clostridium akagii TaxID=91623 RepID=UPI000478ED17|nr:DUF512 domain-containing protein [Clostridium akagii]
MKNEILKVDKGSIAEELGIEIGDRIISINGTEVTDILDYRFLMSDDYVVIELEKVNINEIWELEVEKDFDENFGIEFKDQIMDEAKSCKNNCIFCFIDQLPKGMRKPLYFKDDDSRLSFLQGNFVTLTNLTDEDIDRIIKYKISPINVSVHTTNPNLRVKMLNNRFAGNIIERLEKLAKGKINMNCQIVMCPGVNDGNELKRTVLDLYKFYPYIKNVAAVPVGITKYREGLFSMEIYNEKSASAQLMLASKMQDEFIKKIGSPFIRLSDEFYVVAKMDVPDKTFYKDFDQLEDGIGMIRIFRDNIEKSLSTLDGKRKGEFTLITGSSAYKEIKAAAEKISSKNHKITIDVVMILNRYFGETITVAGLLTATDIIDQLKGKGISKHMILPGNMLKSGTEIFLDDITIKDVEKNLNTKVLVCDYTGDDLVQIINEYSEEDN